MITSGEYCGVSMKLRGKRAMLLTTNRGQLTTRYIGGWVLAQFDDTSLTGSGGRSNYWGYGWHLLPRTSFRNFS